MGQGKHSKIQGRGRFQGEKRMMEKTRVFSRVICQSPKFILKQCCHFQGDLPILGRNRRLNSKIQGKGRFQGEKRIMKKGIFRVFSQLHFFLARFSRKFRYFREKFTFLLREKIDVFFFKSREGKGEFATQQGEHAVSKWQHCHYPTSMKSELPLAGF